MSESVALPELRKPKLTKIEKVNEKNLLILSKHSHHRITISLLVLVSLVVMGSIAITIIYVVKKVKAKLSTDPVGVVCLLNELSAESVINAGPMEEMHSDEVVSGPQGEHNIVFVQD